MKLTVAEFAHVRSQGLFIAERCAACGKLLNQTLRCTIAGKSEVYCSALCRDGVFFGDPHQAKKHSTAGRCAFCGAGLEHKNRGALYCGDACRMRYSRVRERNGTRRIPETRTPAQSNQRVTDVKTAGQGNRITGAPQRLESALGRVSGKFGMPVAEKQRISGNRGS
jgi:hypothetical protein